jgi:hypothetical protein
MTSNQKISKIERDLQESLRILKQYNDNSLNETLAHTLDNRSSFNHGHHRKNYAPSNEFVRNAPHNNSMRISNRSQAHYVQRNVSHSAIDGRVKIVPRPVDLNQIQLEYQKSFTRAEKPKETQMKSIEVAISMAESLLRETDICGPDSPKKEVTNPTPAAVGLVETSKPVAESQSDFLGKFSSQLSSTRTEENNNIWNYDELNDLRMRFISLLAPDKLNDKVSFY